MLGGLIIKGQYKQLSCHIDFFEMFLRIKAIHGQPYVTFFMIAIVLLN